MQHNTHKKNDKGRALKTFAAVSTISALILFLIVVFRSLWVLIKLII